MMACSNPLTIEPVRTTVQLKAFITFPQTLYRHDAHWIAPLLFEQKQRLSSNSPFLAHSPYQLWLAKRGSHIVGRISAQINHHYQQRYADKTGYFGMLEAQNNGEVFAQLLQTAEQWLHDRGMQRICGPFNLSINQEIGLLVDGFDTPPFVMMGHGLPYTGSRIEACGYHKAVDVLAYRISRNDLTMPKAVKTLIERAAKRVSIRCLNKKRFQQELATLRAIFNDAWSDNWGFVPFTEQEFAEVGHTMRYLLDAELVQIAEVDNEPVAFILALPNINEAARDLQGKLLPLGWLKLLWRLKVTFPSSARIPLMGVKKRYQHTRLGPILAFMVIDRVCQALIKRGVTCAEMSWILETNKGMCHMINAVGGQAYKRYRLYEKALAP